MCSEVDDLQVLLADPSAFNEIMSGYDNAVDCYQSLLHEAKRSLSTFDEYIAFYSSCLAEGPSDFVKNDLETNAARSLKNMVLKSSRAGRQFPVYSVAELHRRVNQYQKLTVESVDNLVTHRSVAFTTLEHIFDNTEDNSQVYGILDGLFDETPDTPSDLTAILARARFVVATSSIKRNIPAYERHVQELITELPDFRGEDHRSGPELLHAAEQRSFADPEKIELAQSSLARGTEDALEAFLYLSARDVIERDRHEERETSWRGEIQLAKRQLECLLSLFNDELSTERKARAQSYRNLTVSRLESGGQWQSQRDSRVLPDTDFFAAGKACLWAANAIYPHDKRRFIKYLSKSFRHAATASRHKRLGPNQGWFSSKAIHDQAIDVTTTILEELDSSEDITEVVSETMALHNYRRHRAASVVAFDRNALKRASSEINEAFDNLDAVPVYESTEILKTIRKLIRARRLELKREFEAARKQYERNQHSELSLQKRIALVEIKQAIIEGAGDSACETARDAFGDPSPVLTAVEVIHGRKETQFSISSSVLEDVVALDQEARWGFIMLVYLACNVDGEYRIDWIKESLLTL